MNKKYQMHVTDTNGNVVPCVPEKDYPAHVRHIKDMSNFSVQVYGPSGDVCTIVYNVDHIVCVAIQEVEE
jgi:hypothetical protein